MKQVTAILLVSTVLLMLYSCGKSTNSYKPIKEVEGAIEEATVESYYIKYKSESGLKKIHIKLNDVASFDALFDTGCNYDMVISSQEIQNLIKANTLSEYDIIDSTFTTLADGEIYKHMIIKIKEVSIVDTKGLLHNLSNVRATIMPNPTAPLLLGNGIIDKLARSSYTVDLQKNEIRFD